MKLICTLGKGTLPDAASFKYYVLASNIVCKLSAELQLVAPNHLEAIESFLCEVEQSPEKGEVEPWKSGPIFTINLKIGIAETAVRLTWRQIGRKTRQPTVDEVINALINEHEDNSKQHAKYRDSVLASSVWDLIKYVEERRRDEEKLLRRLHELT